jgi:hypothetical protein
MREAFLEEIRCFATFVLAHSPSALINESKNSLCSKIDYCFSK